MQIWRLLPHHDNKLAAFQQFCARRRIAIGWSNVPDLARIAPQSEAELRQRIKDEHPEYNDAHLGGPSLWNFHREMKAGDTVIVAYGKGRAVFQITGDYEYLEGDAAMMGYPHTRAAELTGIDGNLLWRDIGGKVAAGQSPYLSAARCVTAPAAASRVYMEGAKYDVSSTARERNPLARAACLEKHGFACLVCGFHFGRVFGSVAEGLIHVHHLNPLSSSQGEHEVDPAHDLVPLCPNCHAVAHRRDPPFDLDELREMRASSGARD